MFQNHTYAWCSFLARSYTIASHLGDSYIMGILPQRLKAETENGYLVSTFCIVACLVLYNFVECAEPASSLFSSYTDLWSVWFPNSRKHYITLYEHLWNSRCSWCVAVIKFLLHHCCRSVLCFRTVVLVSHMSACIHKSGLNSCQAMKEYSSHWWSAMVANVRGITNLDSWI